MNSSHYTFNKPGNDKIITRVVLPLLLLFGLGIRLYISNHDLPLLFQKCVVDDAFFYLNISKHIASGQGATFDGSIMTNGFHPVYAILLVPVFWFTHANLQAPLHWALGLLSVFNVMTGLVVFFIVRKIAGSHAGLAAAFLWLFNPYVVLISLSGVEVGISAFFISVCILHYIGIRNRNEIDKKDTALSSALTALALLSRIDSVFIFAAIALDMLYCSNRRRDKLIRSISRCALYLSVTILFMAPWFAWNIARFGTIRQISGVTLPNIAHTMYLDQYGTYLSPGFIKTELFHLKLWISHIALYSGGASLWILFSLAVLWMLFNKGARAAAADLLNRMERISFVLLAAVFVVSFYALYFWGWLRPWYYLSVILAITLFLGILAGFVQELLRSRFKLLSSPGIITMFTLLAFVVCFTYSGYGAWKRGLFAFQKQLYDSALWLNENTGKNEKIGAISAGIYGYITKRTIDLAGVVNAEAYRAMRNRRIFDYLLEKKMSYLVDRQDMIEFYSRRFDRNGFLHRLTPVKSFGPNPADIVVYKLPQTQDNQPGGKAE
jgi:hypothetical protein